MTRDEIFQKLQTVFRDVFKDPALVIHDAMTAHDYDKWDSLNHIHLIDEVEKSFGCRFSNSEIARLANVGDLVALIAKKLG